MPSKSPKKTKNPTPLSEAFEPASIERNDHEALRRYVANRLLYTIGKDPKTDTKADWRWPVWLVTSRSRTGSRPRASNTARRSSASTTSRWNSWSVAR